MKKALFKGMIAAACLATASAQAAVLNFEGFAHGQVIDNEYSDVTISAVNFTGPNLAVAFDTNNPTNDPDLAAPFYSSPADLAAEQTNPFVAGPNPFYPGNILIIQENNDGCLIDGVCDEPDDEGSRPAGYISFDFKGVIELLSIDFFDVEPAEDGTTPDNRIDIWDGSDTFVGTIGYTPDTGGDRLWDQVLFDSSVNPALANIGRIDVYFGGSGGLDNLTYSVVPLPASVWLFGTALLGFIGYSRRTSV